MSTEIRFRFHRGGLTDSLATTEKVVNIDQLRELINTKGGLLDRIVPADHIKFRPLGPLSQRQRENGHWETHLVLINHEPMGYADGVL